jgi:hypothetical protein
MQKPVDFSFQKSKTRRGQKIKIVKSSKKINNSLKYNNILSGDTEKPVFVPL